MKPLKPSEKRLVLVLSFLFFAFGGILLLKHGVDSKDQSLKQKDLLSAQLQQARLLTENSQDWADFQEWLNSHAPVLDDNATAKLTEDVLQKAKDFHVNISQQQLLEPVTENGYREAAIQLKAKSSMESMIRWLSELEKMHDFCYYKSLALRKDERGDMTARVVVAIKGKPAS